MAEARFPEAIVERFRKLALERIERLEAGWQTLIRGAGSSELAAQVMRDLHTLKGDSRVIGFREVNLLCHKLEEMLVFAQNSGYHVSDDLDMVVTMATGFMAMLVRRPPGHATAAIDLDGFLEQVEETLSDARQGPVPARALSLTRGPLSSHQATDRVSPPTQRRLAAAATSIFLEYLAASGRSRDRLRSVWLDLCQHLTSFSSVALAPRLARHEMAALQLGRDLSKQVEVAFDLEGIRTSSEAAEALDILVLHAVRNAVDHGIEFPEERRAAGKRPQGRIGVRARAIDGTLALEIEDDGRGVDFDAVRRRGAETGIISLGASSYASEPELLELLVHPGFSTQSVPSDLSGRGIGLDAARAALAIVGGKLEISTRAGQGTTARGIVPHVQSRIPVRRFPAPAGDLFLAVSTSWEPDPEPDSEPDSSKAGSPEVLDPLQLLGIADGMTQEVGRTMVVNLRQGASRVAFLAAGAPEPCFADRICMTDDTELAEVVLLEGAEGILFRPERL